MKHYLVLFWDKWLMMPIDWLKAIDVEVPKGWPLIGYKIGVICLIVFILLEIYARVSKRLNRWMWSRDFYETRELGERLPTDQNFVESIEAARNPERVIEPLLKSREYGRAAEIYSSINQPKLAAKYFGKAGDKLRAATEWAKAGYTVKAAKLLMRHGDYATAARFFEEKERYADAAKAFIKLNDISTAAQMFARAGKYKEALANFTAFFNDPPGDAAIEIKAADDAYAMLESEQGKAKILNEQRMALLLPIAERFVAGSRFDLAARLFKELGDNVRAAETYVKAGRLEEAARCYREAGNTREANLAGARFMESRQRWPDAGKAYAAADEWRRAGDCFAKANDAQRAAECYARAGEFYGAALAYSHMGKYDDAVHLLQKIKETDRIFDMSRALLGRCFYELHDYAHCAATLDNHLIGKRVESGNVDYFYMLALAYEQLGELEKSAEILRKIGSVNLMYKDVTQRISNIASRISISVGEKAVTPPSMQPTIRGEAMDTVEHLLGGRYRLERELGRGGMGMVYLARDMQLDRLVALKFLGSLVDDSEEFRQRFIREAKAAARVNHPNIVHIYDISASLGRAYIAMEYVEGMNLHAYVHKWGALQPREAVNIMVQACDALGAIHEVGIIHRDIKPDNILVAKGGLVKLSDFGLAKAGNSRITGTNAIMGTPAYMSPEQARGQEADPRSDIYSMGLVLYEMLTAATPFRDGDLLQRQQLEMPPEPKTIIPAVSDELNGIVMKAIQKNPEERYQSAGDLIAALRQLPTE
jgi:tetratricopeptide (TPR) repeat protein